MHRVLASSCLLFAAACLQHVAPVDETADGGGSFPVGTPIPSRCPGGCQAGTRCNASGQCVFGCRFQPTCEQRACGGDGCAGSCGRCPQDATCVSFQCDPGCAFSVVLTRSDRERLELRGWDAQFASCTRGPTNPLLSVMSVPRFFNGTPESVATVVLLAQEELEPHQQYPLGDRSHLRSVSVSLRGLGSGWDGDYYSTAPDAGVLLQVGAYDRAAGGSFEVDFQPGSTVGTAGRWLQLEGRISGRF